MEKVQFQFSDVATLLQHNRCLLSAIKVEMVNSESRVTAFRKLTFDSRTGHLVARQRESRWRSRSFTKALRQCKRS